MKAKWISFQLEERRFGAKTDLWYVWSLKEPSAHLGVVKWYGSWRKYAFFPAAQALFEHDCLRDIAEFIESETTKHRTGKRGFSEVGNG